MAGRMLCVCLASVFLPASLFEGFKNCRLKTFSGDNFNLKASFLVTERKKLVLDL